MVKKTIKKYIGKLSDQFVWSRYLNVLKNLEMNKPQLFEGELSDLLIIAPHPDDDVIGCGGTIAKYASQGCKIKVIIITDGGKGDPSIPYHDLVNIRKQEAEKALYSIGVEDVEFLNFRDGDVNRNMLRLKEELFKRILPFHNVFTPFITDNHSDHIHTTKALYAALKEMHKEKIEIWSYELWSPCLANTLVDITEQMQLKLSSILWHASQIKNIDYAEKIKGLNTYRSISVGKSNVKYCEGFYKCNRREFIKKFKKLANSQ